jgi:hypothetical protein
VSIRFLADEDIDVAIIRRRTMTRHFSNRLNAGLHAPGLFVLPQEENAVGQIIEWLLRVWADSNPDEWRNRIVYGPPR